MNRLFYWINPFLPLFFLTIPNIHPPAQGINKVEFLGVMDMVSEKRIGVIGIIIEDRQQVPQVNSLLSSFNEVIIGRMGLPYHERSLSIISIIVDGSTDEIGALTGRLGQIPGIKVKSTLVTR
jgi:putative iron-only hydrogenase system regulator